MSENRNPNHDRSTVSRPTAAVYNHPDDVLGDARLTRDEKRAILASWASDACSVENAPAVRQLGSGAIVSLADILASLNELDHSNDPVSAGRRIGRLPPRKPGDVLRYTRYPIAPAAHLNDDDDDPPPSPAAARPWVPTPLVNAQAA